MSKLPSLKRINFLVFGLCLFLSFTFWLLTQLSDNQKSYSPFKIEYINLPEGYIVSEALPEEINLEIESQGFQLLRYELMPSRNFLQIDLSKIKYNGSDRSKKGAWVSSQYSTDLEGQLKNQVEISAILPDTIFVELEEKRSQQLPIVLENRLEELPGYRFEKLSCNPDSVWVTAPVSFFENHQEVICVIESAPSFTDSISLRQNIQLEGQGWLEPKQTEVTIIRENVIKQSMSIPIQVLNLPSNKSLKLFPSVANIEFMSTPSQKKRLNKSDFALEVDYNELANNPDINRLSVQVSRYPEKIEGLKLSVAKVEFILKGK